jgi:hypothetical protein
MLFTLMLEDAAWTSVLTDLFHSSLVQYIVLSMRMYVFESFEKLYASKTKDRVQQVVSCRTKSKTFVFFKLAPHSGTTEDCRLFQAANEQGSLACSTFRINDFTRQPWLYIAWKTT